MSSHAIKTACLTWLRYAKQYPYVCDEVGYSYKADVAAMDERQLIEIEIKTSKSDLLRDFETKGSKHSRYAAPIAQAAWHPNKFYFAVPAALAAATTAVIAEKAPAYGLIVYTEPEHAAIYSPWNALSVTRSAKALHAEPPRPSLKEMFLKRMGSDLCQFHMMRQHYGGLFAHMRALSEKMIAAETATVPDL